MININQIICTHCKEGVVWILECIEVHIIILMIADTCTEVVINTGILNIEVEIWLNSKAQYTDKAQIEANRDYKMIIIMRWM